MKNLITFDLQTADPSVERMDEITAYAKREHQELTNTDRGKQVIVHVKL